MENIEFNSYMTDVYRLVRTMVIKIKAVAIRDNTVLQERGYPVSNDKRTWRYYMNMNGDYHPTDEIMTVISIDTGEEIVFNKQNLIIHLATFREYSRGGYWFNRLVERYPGQAELVKGILSPIPYETTISAANYKILKYNTTLVQWNEEQLIPNLQKFIDGVVPQLFNHEYIYTDNLMLPVGIMILYADIVKAVCTIRHEAIGSRHAHSFYIWSRIDSYVEFSKYKASLTREQTLWLYKNIVWLNSNPGAQYTFNLLVKNLLTDARVPIAKYDLVENTKDQLVDLTPVPLYRKLQINLQDDYGRDPTYIDTLAMIAKERDQASENWNQTAIWYYDALEKGTFSIHSELPTKVLESKMMDYTNRHINTKMSVTFNNWIYLTGKGYYKGRILVKDPKDGKEVRMPVGDAYYLWRYLTDLSKGRPGTVICPAYYQNVMKVVPPSLEEIVRVGWKDFIPLSMANDIRKLWVPPQIFISPEYLMSNSEEIYAVMWKHTKIYAQFYDLNKRAHVQNAVGSMYESGFIEITDLTTYDELLRRYEFDFTEHSPEEARYFAWEIFKKVTGWDTSSNPSLRIKQNALIDMMMTLSSYTIQTVREMDDGLNTTELINEIFVGDSRLTGPGNRSLGDYSAVMLTTPSNMDGIRGLKSVTDIALPEKGTFTTRGSNFAKIITEDHFVRVDADKDYRRYAVKIVDESYFRPMPRPEKTLPPTDYGRLEWLDLHKTVPPTNYGRLNYPGDDDE